MTENERERERERERGREKGIHKLEGYIFDDLGYPLPFWEYHTKC